MKTINTSSMIDTILTLKAVHKVRRPKIGRRVVCHHDSGGIMTMGGGGLAKLYLGKCMYSNFTCRLLKIRSKSGDSNMPRRLEACWLVSIALWMCYVGSHELALKLADISTRDNIPRNQNKWHRNLIYYINSSKLRSNRIVKPDSIVFYTSVFVFVLILLPSIHTTKVMAECK